MRPIRLGEWWWPIVGALFLLQFAVTAFIKLDKGLGDDLLWMSHAALVIGGIGLIVRWRWLVAAALTGILLTHTLWILDLCAGMLGYGFPLGISYYMADAGLSTWLSTGHHLYVLPLMTWIVLRAGRYPWRALPATMLIFAALTLASYWITTPERNVNRVHGIVPDFGFPPFLWANTLEGFSFLAALNALSAVILFIPMAGLLYILTASIHRRDGSAERRDA